MPSPPLSPIPRRIITPSMVDLLSGLEAASARDYERDTRSTEDDDGRNSPAPSLGPEIRTTSPSPRRREGMMMAQEDPDALSPTHTGASLRRYGSPSSPTTSRYYSAPSQPPHFISSQATGQSTMSTTTIDRAFADIHNTLNQLASSPSSDRGKGPAQPVNYQHGYPTPPSTNTMASQNTPSAPSRGNFGFGSGPSFPFGIPGGAPVGLGLSSQDGRPIFPESRNEARRLEAVSEHTEPSTSSDRSSSPSPSPRPYARSIPASPSKASTALSATSIAQKFPLPPTPSRGGRSPAPGDKPVTPLSSPSKASALIRMFESKSGDAPPPPPQPIFARSSAAKSVTSSTPTQNSPAAALSSRFDTPTQRFDTIPTATRPAPPSSYRPPPITGFQPPLLGRASPENVMIPLQPSPSPSPKSGSSFKNLVASWRSKASSPSSKEKEVSPESSGAALERSRGWNVSIRRRRRNEDGQNLAERAEEPAPLLEEVEQAAPVSAYARELEQAARNEQALPVPVGKASSEHSRASDSISSISTRPRIVSGEAVRIGSLWYLNVHDDDKAPFYEWVQADARLYKEGLRLAWRTDTGAQATVTFDMEFCEGNPNHPLAKDDIGTLAAERQGSLADDLYPFKLVYDDGTERLACTSARDRVRWVNVIWSVLEQTRLDGPAIRSSLHVARPTSVFSSTTEGSASTHHDVQHDLLPPQSPFASLHSSDDAFISTSGGLHAPIVSRGSRHLAAGPERTRSLRRTASEADLSDAAGGPEAFRDADRHSSPDDQPALVPQATQSRPVSRDFAFAQQRSPPKADMPVSVDAPSATPQTVASSSLPSYHTAQTTYGRPQSMSSENTFGVAPHSGQVPPPASSSGTMYSARQSESTVRPATEAARPNTAYSQAATMYTAPDGQMYVGTGSMYTAPSDTFGTALLPSATMYTASQAAPTDSATTTLRGEPSPPSSEYLSADTARESIYTTARPGSAAGSARSATSTARNTTSDSDNASYHSAPPPVPSRDSMYGPASEGSAIAGTASPGGRRYQLYDPPVASVRAPTTAESSSRPSSMYGTAPLPISRASLYAESLYSNEQSGALTTISDMDNEDIIANLERQSSAGSTYYTLAGIQRRPAQVRSSRAGFDTMYTADSAAYVLANPALGSNAPTAYATARESAYTTALGSAMTAEAYRTAEGSTVHVSPVASAAPPPSEPYKSSSSESSASSRSRRVPVPSIPPTEPSEPSEPSGAGTVVSFPTTIESAESRVGLEYDLNRMLNYIHGQDTVREGQTNRMANQLDRIESKVIDISHQLVDSPPPLPTKTRSRSSSASSTETARPVTPPAFIVPQSITDRLDDMQHVLGELLGQNQSLMDEVSRRRSIDLELPSSNQKRMEDMMRRILAKLGDVDLYDQPFEEEPYKPKSKKASTVVISDDEASMYEGGSIDTDAYGRRLTTPANSYTTEYANKLRNRFSGVPESLLEGSVPGSEFDEEFAMQDLPPADPPQEHVLPRVQVPTHLLKRRQPQYASAATTPNMRQSTIPEEPGEEYEEEVQSEYTEQDPEQDQRAYVETEPEEEDLEPIPYRQEDEYVRDPSVYSEDYEPRQPARRLPPPQPVDLPTPVNSLKNMPPYNPASYQGRPPFQNGMPVPPGPTEMPPRPSLPRIAGVRDPISTTYYRRGFPPPGPMGPMGPMGMGMGMGMPPMGMFPGPMGIPGPGMGPMMPGLRPGLGGVYGPNTNPHLRRPGMFPPGIPGAHGDYGLPAAARYNNTGPSRPGQPMPGALTPDTGLGNSTSESSSSVSSVTDTTPSATTQEIVTPATAVTPLVPPIIHEAPAVQFEEPLTHTHTHTTTTVSTDDTLRRAMAQATTMAQASGEQQNEMSRYLHGLNDLLERNKSSTDRELAQILGDLAGLRDELKPKHVMGRVLPDGTVVLSNGDVVDGVRGAPLPGAEHLPPPPPSVPRLSGRVLPDGTVMVGDAVVDGIRGAPQPAAAAEPLAPQMYKDMEQDRKLASLMDKVSELMRRTAPHEERPAEPLTAGLDILETASTHAAAPTPRHHTDVLREKTVIKEHEVIREGPGSMHKEVELETETQRNTVQPPTTLGNMPSGTPSRVNPRTGKPLSLPQPLSLQPRDPSPIQTDYGLPDQGQLIREEHEERPGGMPVSTKTTTRTYLRPDGTTVTVADAAPTMPVGSNSAPKSQPPATVLGNMAPSENPPSTAGFPPTAMGMPNVPSGPPRAGAAYSDHAAVIQGPTPTLPTHAETSEEITKAPLIPVTDSKNTSTEGTKFPVGPTVGPPAGAAGAPGPAKSAAGDKPPAAVWSTNGPKDPAPPKPVSNLANTPSDAPKPAATPAGAADKLAAPASGGGGPPPPASLGNMPTAPAGGDKPAGAAAPSTAGVPAGGAPSAAGAPAAAPVAPAAPTAPASDKPKLGVHWDKHLHDKDAKGPDVNVLKKAGPPPPTALGNMPTAPADKPAAGPAAPPSIPTDPAGAKSAGAAPPAPAGEPKPAGPPAPATVGNMPAGGGAPTPAAGAGPGAGAPAGTAAVPPAGSAKPAAATGAAPASTSNVPVGKAPMPTPSVWQTNTPKNPAPPAATTLGNTPTGGAPAPAASAGRPAGGPAVVPAPATSGGGATQPLNPNDKSTRFSDTTAIVPDTSGGSGTASAPGTPGKLRKSPPGSAPGGPIPASDLANTPSAPAAADPKGKAAAPAGGAGGAIAPASGGPSGAPSSKIVHEIPLPAPHQLEEFIMPDGTVAYIKKGTKPGPAAPAAAGGAAPSAPSAPADAVSGKSGDKGKAASGGAAPGMSAAGSAAAPPAAPNESAMGHGHCSTCCPSAPKTAAGKPVESCAHQDGPIAISAPSAPATAVSNKPAPNKLTKPAGPVPPAVAAGPSSGPAGPAEPVLPTDMANTATAPAGPSAAGPPGKLTKGKGKDLTPEEQNMENARNLATKQKAAAEQAAAEKAGRDAIDKAKADKAKVYEDRHKANADTLADLKKLLEALQKDNKDQSTAADKRRADKVIRDKKYQETLDKLVVQKEENKKKDEDKAKSDVEKAKKEKDGTQAVLDAIQKFGTQEKEFLDRLGKGILEQNSKQHEETRKAAKASARDQVAFNLAGYLDDFSKALSGEVRSLLHEVSGLRETRRALYYELAELLLMKGRQSAGDLMAIMPYPSKPPAKPDDKNKPKPPAAGGDKKPAGIPAWSGWMPPMPPGAGAAPPAAPPAVAAPASAAPRPLPVPGGAPAFAMMPGAVPAPPPPTPGGRPLPQL